MIRQAEAQAPEKAAIRETRRYERQVLRYVEAELYAYPWRKQEIERLRNDILAATPERAAARSEEVGNPTLLRAMRLLTSKRLERLTSNFEAITRVYESLDDVKQRLVDMRYWQREYTDYGIQQRLHISRSTYFQWRNKVLRAIATEMGLL